MVSITLLSIVLIGAGSLSPFCQVLALKVLPARDGLSPDKLQHDAAAVLRDIAGPLDRQLAHIDDVVYNLGRDKLVVMTSTTSKYSALTQNLYLSMRSVGRSKLLVFCEDAACEPQLRGQGMHVVSTGSGLSEGGLYDSPGFNAITGRKPAYVYSLLRRGYAVLWTDSDTSWLTDSVASLAALDKAFAAQDDSKMRGEKGLPLDAPLGLRRANTGFFLVRPTEVGKALVASWLLNMGPGLKDQKLQDQRVFQSSLWSQCQRICSEELQACGPEADCVLLSRERCPNGSIPKWRWSKKALAFHANWHDGISAKVEQMRMKGLWLLKP
mmetsp:Transcript_52742/g.153378  ORF Transcript_52742/g.153378 Transcript_52742/m.153378 type:complete len:326 (-) Transcript_52742:106-1083(-)